VAIVALQRPVLGVGLIVASRIIGNEALTFLRVGPVGIGLYEAVAVICLPVLVTAAVMRSRRLWVSWPWKAPLLLLVAWAAFSLRWSANPSEGLGDLIPVLPVLLNVTLVLVFVRTWEDLRTVLWCWLGAAVLLCLATLLLNLVGIDVGEVSFQAAARGGRETGLGQQPNWFAMTLYFIVPAAFGLAYLERGSARVAAVLGGSLVFLVMVSTGSRGGVAATVIALLVSALGSPRVRRWVLRALGGGGAGLALAFVLDPGGISRAIGRILGSDAFMVNYRPWNWQACMEMFVDSRGLGVGLGGYSDILPAYNSLLASTVYDYPHGVFWQVLAHLGLVGLALLAWGVWRVFRMQREAARRAAQGPLRVMVKVMGGTLVGYAAWTFFEFTLLEKPFFEFLALATALHLLLGRR